MRTVIAAVLLLSGVAASAPALADDLDGGEARLSWELAFGAPSGALDSRYALAFGYRDAWADAPMLQLARLDVSDEATVARLAGMPLLWRDRVNQRDDAFAYSSNPLTWVWWAITGVAITAYAINQADDDEPAVTATGTGGS